MPAEYRRRKTRTMPPSRMRMSSTMVVLLLGCRSDKQRLSTLDRSSLEAARTCRASTRPVLSGCRKRGHELSRAKRCDREAATSTRKCCSLPAQQRHGAGGTRCVSARGDSLRPLQIANQGSGSAAFTGPSDFSLMVQSALLDPIRVQSVSILQ